MDEFRSESKSSRYIDNAPIIILNCSIFGSYVFLVIEALIGKFTRPSAIVWLDKVMLKVDIYPTITFPNSLILFALSLNQRHVIGFLILLLLDIAFAIVCSLIIMKTKITAIKYIEILSYYLFSYVTFLYLMPLSLDYLFRGK